MKLFGVPFTSKEVALKAILKWQSLTKLPDQELKYVNINEVPYKPKKDGDWEHLYLVMYGGQTDFYAYNAWAEIFLQEYATEDTYISMLSPNTVSMSYSLQVQVDEQKEDWFLEGEFIEETMRLGGINFKALEQISELKKKRNKKEPKQ